MEITSLLHTLIRTSNRVNEMALYSLFCTLNGCCREESACYHTNANEPVKRHSKVVGVEISSAESFCSTSQFLAHSGS